MTETTPTPWIVRYWRRQRPAILVSAVFVPLAIYSGMWGAVAGVALCMALSMMGEY